MALSHAGVLGAFVILLMAIGLAGPMVTQAKNDLKTATQADGSTPIVNQYQDTTYGIRDITFGKFTYAMHNGTALPTPFAPPSSNGAMTINLWDTDVSTDDQKKGKAMSEAGFAFVFMGMLITIAFVVAAFTQMIPVDAWMIGLVMFVFNLIGVSLAVDYPFQIGMIADGEGTIGWGGALLIVGFILNRP